MPTSSIHAPICSGSISIFTPNALRTSALPLWLEIARVPCFATGIPVPATTNAAVVEILNVCAPSPPVPEVSTTKGCWGRTFVDFSRIARAAPVISSIVSPLIRRAVMNEATCADVASPLIISFIVSTVSRSVKSCPSTTFWIVSRITVISSCFSEFLFAENQKSLKIKVPHSILPSTPPISPTPARNR